MDGALRNLCWHGEEIVRGVGCQICDANWATMPQTTLSETDASDLGTVRSP